MTRINPGPSRVREERVDGRGAREHFVCSCGSDEQRQAYDSVRHFSLLPTHYLKPYLGSA